jgi:hypothetical protein
MFAQDAARLGRLLFRAHFGAIEQALEQINYTFGCIENIVNARMQPSRSLAQMAY